MPLRSGRTNHKKRPHHHTVAYLMERVPLEGMRWMRDHIVRRLLRSRALEKFRLADHYYLVALDGTGFVSFRHRHCPHCLKREYPGGNTIYYHPVLEARLVCRNGLAISIGTEFIEKPAPEVKEDCELNAFYRLIPRVREAFPRLPICLLLDALYLNQTVMNPCENHRLEWITTFKKGSLAEFLPVCRETEKRVGQAVSGPPARLLISPRTGPARILSHDSRPAGGKTNFPPQIAMVCLFCAAPDLTPCSRSIAPPPEKVLVRAAKSHSSLTGVSKCYIICVK